MTKAIVITVSDSRAAGLREDRSGPAVARVLAMAGFHVAEIVVVADEQSLLEAQLRHHANSARLVITTGGTGIAPRDITPEATRAVCDRILDGVAEQMRTAGKHETPFAVLSRGICGTRGTVAHLESAGKPAGGRDLARCGARTIAARSASP